MKYSSQAVAKPYFIFALILLAGEILKEADLWARRPGTGEIPARDLSALIGRKLIRDIPRNTQMHWSDVE